MVGNRNHPLNQQHYNEETLEEYVLGQLLPDEEAQIRQHLEKCPLCRSAVVDIRVLCQRLSADLNHELNQATPGPQLNFDQIAAEWRKPPRRVTLLFKLQQFAPGASYLLLIVLLVAAFMVLFPSPSAATLNSLSLADNYYGPPAIVTAMTEQGLVVVKLEAGATEIVTHLDHVRDPHNLQLSPDGQWLAFQERNTLHIVRTKNANERIRVDVRDTADWSWSPNSQMLAYTNGIGQLAIFDVETHANQIIVPAEESAWGMPVWTDNSRQLAYAVAYPLPTTGGPHLRQSIWRVTLHTGYRVELARNTQPDSMLLIPADWSRDNRALLAWDINTSSNDQRPNLYRVDVSGHGVLPVEGRSLAQGTRLAWSVSSQDITLVARSGVLHTINLTGDFADAAQIVTIPEQIPWPQSLDWAPNGAWMAYAVAGAAEGRGVYLYAPQEAELRSVRLPGGATEKAAYWAGAEHLFVIRQPQNSFTSELWMVPLTTGETPQRVMSNISLPQAGSYNGWLWQNVLATQVIGTP